MEIKREYFDNGNIAIERHYENNIIHKDDGPAHIVYNRHQKIVQESYYLNGQHYEDIFQWSVATGCLNK